MKTTKDIIADTLLNFCIGREQDKRGKEAWGREGDVWRAEAVVAALKRAGYEITETKD